MIEITFISLMLLIVIQGVICAANVCPKSHGIIIRWLIITPTITALYTLHCIANGNYIVFSSDILRALATNAVYILLTGHLIGKEWLTGGKK